MPTIGTPAPAAVRSAAMMTGMFARMAASPFSTHAWSIAAGRKQPSSMSLSPVLTVTGDTGLRRRGARGEHDGQGDQQQRCGPAEGERAGGQRHGLVAISPKRRLNASRAGIRFNAELLSEQRKQSRARQLIPLPLRRLMYDASPSRRRRWRRFPAVERLTAGDGVALTFDDGPDAETTAVLEALETH